jgi:hypothetical protein
VGPQGAVGLDSVEFVTGRCRAHGEVECGGQRKVLGGARVVHAREVAAAVEDVLSSSGPLPEHGIAARLAARSHVGQ